MAAGIAKNTTNATQPIQNDRGSCWLTRQHSRQIDVVGVSQPGRHAHVLDTGSAERLDGHVDADVDADRRSLVVGRTPPVLALDGEGELEQVPEAAVLGVDQRGPVAVLDDATVVEHEDLVDHVERRQPVGDDERGAPDHQLGDRGRDLLLGRGVDARRRLVEHDEVGLAEPHPGEREQLGLSGGQSGTAGAERAVDAALDEHVEPDRPQRVLDAGVRRLRVVQRDVVADRALEQLDLLGHERDALGAARAIGMSAIGNPAELELALGRLDEAEQQARERRLAAAGASDDADRPAAGDRDVDVVEDRSASSS